MAEYIEPVKAKTDKAEKLLRAGIRCRLSAPQILDHWRSAKKVYEPSQGQNVFVEKLSPLWKDSPSVDDCWSFVEAVFSLLKQP
jgi:hypothetical protein